MAEADPNRFIVLNRKFLKNLSAREHQELMTLLHKACPADHRYWVCNQDEPYADVVRETILEGETAKEQLPGFTQELEDELPFNVYLYRNVFFRVDGLKAKSYAEAAQKAFAYIKQCPEDFQTWLRPGGEVGNVQEAEQGIGVLVDQLTEDGDVEDSCWMPDSVDYEVAHRGQVGGDDEPA